MPYCKLSSTVTHDVSIYHYIFDFPAGMIETSPDLPPDLVDTVRNFLTVYKVIEKCDDTIMRLPPSKYSEIYDVEQDIYNWLRKILPALKSRDKRMQSVILGALRPSCEKRFHTPRKEKKILYSSSGEKKCGHIVPIKYLKPTKEGVLPTDAKVIECDYCEKRYFKDYAFQEHKCQQKGDFARTCSKCGKTWENLRSPLNYEWHVKSCNGAGTDTSRRKDKLRAKAAAGDCTDPAAVASSPHKTRMSTQRLQASSKSDVTPESCEEYVIIRGKTFHKKLYIPRPCPECPTRAFQTWNGFKQHVCQCNLADAEYHSSRAKHNKNDDPIDSDDVNPRKSRKQRARLFQCEDCGREFRTESNKQQHQSYGSCSVTETKPKGKPRAGDCTYCGKECGNQANLDRHLKSGRCEKAPPPSQHDKQSDTKCARCSHNFPSKSAKEKHMKYCNASPAKAPSSTAAETSVHRCQQCFYCFATPDHLHHHKDRIHPHLGTHQCFACRKEYLTKPELKQHVSTCPVPRPCPRCTLDIDPKKYDKHVLSCKYFLTCISCSKTCRSRSGLKQHLQDKHAAESISCSSCGLLFAHDNAKDKHVGHCNDGQKKGSHANMSTVPPPNVRSRSLPSTSRLSSKVHLAPTSVHTSTSAAAQQVPLVTQHASSKSKDKHVKATAPHALPTPVVHRIHLTSPDDIKRKHKMAKEFAEEVFPVHVKHDSKQSWKHNTQQRKRHPNTIVKKFPGEDVAHSKNYSPRSWEAQITGQKSSISPMSSPPQNTPERFTSWGRAYRRMMRCINYAGLEELFSTLTLPGVKLNIQTRFTSNDEIDPISESLRPQDDTEGLVAVLTEGDGNCCPRALSRLLFDDPERHLEVRVRIVAEAVMNARRYINSAMLRRGQRNTHDYDVHEFYAMVSPTKLEVEPKIKDDAYYMLMFQREIFHIRQLNIWMGMWQLHIASNAFQVPICIIHPDRSRRDVVCFYDRMIYPHRQPATDMTLHLMWTTTQNEHNKNVDKDLRQTQLKSINHFVPLVVRDK